MKQVFNNDMVAHVWAQQSQDSGRNANDSFYFTGDTIYSYGSHFPIAKFIKPSLVLFNSDSYGITTSKHQTLTRQAIPNCCKIFFVPNLEIYYGSKFDYEINQNKITHKKNVKYFKDEINDCILKAERARSNKYWYNQRAINLCNQLNDYIIEFKLRLKPFVLPDGKELKIKADKARKIALAKKKKLEAKILKDNQEKINQWLSGDPVRLPYNVKCNTMLRVKGETIETSRNATFPIAHAYLALKTINKCIEEKTTFKTNGKTIRLGHFKIDHIAVNGDVKAGCHFVKYCEIKRIEKDILQWRENYKTTEEDQKNG